MAQTTQTEYKKIYSAGIVDGVEFNDIEVLAESGDVIRLKISDVLDLRLTHTEIEVLYEYMKYILISKKFNNEI